MSGGLCGGGGVQPREKCFSCFHLGQKVFMWMGVTVTTNNYICCFVLQRQAILKSQPVSP